MSTATPRRGYFGQFGGQYVSETLMPAITELEEAFDTAWADPEFKAEYLRILTDYVGRPSPLTFAENLTRQFGGAQIYLKREDLNHTGAHKINNTVGQVLLAKRMGKKRIIAETGAGQHGVATATTAALFGLECQVFMGEEDIRRQAENVKRMRLMGAEVIGVTSGTGTLKDAMNEAMRDWVATVDDTFYVIGSVAGPHPYPMMVREFQRIIGDETVQQCDAKFGRQPDSVIACVGGGSNAMGIFAAYVDDPAHADVRLIGVEAAGHGLHTHEHAASITGGEVGVLHGSKTFLLQTAEGQIINAHSISAGLDYPGIGPEHAYLHQSGRVEYVSVTDDEAVDAFTLICRKEGIIAALETSHAIAHAARVAPTLPKEHIIVICCSGRGDKDIQSVNDHLNARENG